jgi:hypothetical protein
LKENANIGSLMTSDAGWWIITCTKPGCGRRIASDLKKYAERWGAGASSDVIRDNLECVCGHRGVELTHPDYAGKDVGWEPFPGEGVEVTPSRLVSP